jgi:hypothetical protein
MERGRIRNGPAEFWQQGARAAIVVVDGDPIFCCKLQIPSPVITVEMKALSPSLWPLD